MEVLPQIDLSQNQDGEIWRNGTHTYIGVPPPEPGKKGETKKPPKKGDEEVAAPKKTTIKEKVLFNSAYKLPDRGVLELDFTSTNRPSSKATPIAEHVLANLMAGNARI